MKKLGSLAVLSLVVILHSCGGCDVRPPAVDCSNCPTPSAIPPTPADPPLNQQCATLGVACDCWDHPPNSPWVYVHCCPECSGGVCNAPGPFVPCGGGTPPPSVPPPTPGPSGCRASSADVNSWRNQAKSDSANQQIDITAVACGNIVNIANNCWSQCCELSAEKGNAACSDKLYGQPHWQILRTRDDIEANKIKLIQVHEGSTYAMKVVNGDGCTETMCHGIVKVCGDRDDRSCVVFEVVAGAPACEMIPNSNQGCAQNVPNIPPSRRMPMSYGDTLKKKKSKK